MEVGQYLEFFAAEEKAGTGTSQAKAFCTAVATEPEGPSRGARCIRNGLVLQNPREE